MKKNTYAFDFVNFIHLNRKKILIVAVLVFVFAVLSNFTKPEYSSEAETTNEKYYKSITIEYGDTLYDIAKEHITEEYKDINEYISEVKSINQLSSDKITAGCCIVIPYYAAEKQSF